MMAWRCNELAVDLSPYGNRPWEVLALNGIMTAEEIDAAAGVEPGDEEPAGEGAPSWWGAYGLLSVADQKRYGWCRHAEGEFSALETALEDARAEELDAEGAEQAQEPPRREYRPSGEPCDFTGTISQRAEEVAIALAAANGNVSETARALGVSRPTVYRAIGEEGFARVYAHHRRKLIGPVIEVLEQATRDCIEELVGIATARSSPILREVRDADRIKAADAIIRGYAALSPRGALK